MIVGRSPNQKMENQYSGLYWDCGTILVKAFPFHKSHPLCKIISRSQLLWFCIKVPGSILKTLDFSLFSTGSNVTTRLIVLVNWEIKKFLSVKDGAYYCYCAYVLRISRYSDFLSPMLTITEILLRGLKLSGESRS